MANLKPLASVTKFFASGATVRDCILRRYGKPVTLAASRAKGDFDATPITLFGDARQGRLQQAGRGADQAVEKTFYTLAETRGEEDITGLQGDEIVMVDSGDIYQIQLWRPWRDGPGDEITCTRVGRVGVAPY